VKQGTICLLFLGCCLSVSLRSGAQTAPADTVFSRQALALLEQSYKKQAAENLRLYNGGEYLPHAHGVKGFPFLGSPDPLKGSVFYDGNLYEDVGMQYDLEEDNLVIRDYSGNYSICLVKQKIAYFIIDGHRFVYLQAGNGLPSAGFYESLYSGKTGGYARRQKKILSLDPTGSDASYHSYNEYFIEKGGVYIPVKNERAVRRYYTQLKD
jgi:hypothetical protein